MSETVRFDGALSERKLNDARRMAAHWNGRHEQLKQRSDEIFQLVGTAKGRVTRKPQRDAFLSKLQASAHAQTVARYSKLLTALAQDVLPQDIRVGLDMYTDRGLPALDIFAEKGPSDARLDIMEDCGGSLTNIVCLGLRVIATANSGLRKFILLDEPDCWIEPENVRPFYRVLKQMTERMGFQAIVISHQSTALFDAGTNVIEITGTPQEGLSVANRGDGLDWPDEITPGFRSIHFKNFASFADATLLLGPGLNMVIGKNDIGKSRITRAFRSNMYGGAESSDGEIRHGEKSAQVVYSFERRRSLIWSKQLKKSPVWRLLEADASVAVINGALCEESGKQVPDWVGAIEGVGIAKLAGLDIQLAHQKQPVFLLNDPPSKRASVLSVGRESGRIQTMISLNRESNTRDQQTIKDGEIEIAGVIQQLEALNGLNEVGFLLDDAELILNEAKATFADANRMDQFATGMEQVFSALAKARSELEIFELLRSPPDIAQAIAANTQLELVCKRLQTTQTNLLCAQSESKVLDQLPASVPVLVPTEEISTSGRKISRAKEALGVARTEMDILRTLPDAPPHLHPTDGQDQAARKISAVSGDLKTAQAQLKAMEALPVAAPELHVTQDESKAALRLHELAQALEQARVQAELAMQAHREKGMELAELVSDMGNICPLCGSHVEHSHLTGDAP